MTDHGRRRLLGMSGGLGGLLIVTGGIMPQRWRKPIVDAVLLPAHAQGSPGFLALVSLGIRSATVETRTPSGGAPAPSLASITLSHCDRPNPATLSATASVTLTPAGTLDLSGGAITIDPATQDITYTVPSSIVVDIASISQILVTVTDAGTAWPASISGPALTLLLSGSDLGTSCP